SASQAEGRRFESGIPLNTYGASGSISVLRSHLYSHLRGSEKARDESARGEDGMPLASFLVGKAGLGIASADLQVGVNSLPPLPPPPPSSRRGSGGTRRSTPAIAARFSSRPTVE